MARARRGFTLLELLVAVTIFAIASLGMYGVFHAGMSGYKRIAASLEASNKAAMVFDRLERDLRNSFAYAQEDSFFRGDAAGMAFFAALDLYRNGSRRTDLCRIVYSYDGKDLYRSCGSGSLAIAPLKADAPQAPEALARGVKGFAVSYAATPDVAEPGYSWAPVWPSPSRPEDTPARPVAVRVSIILSDGKDEVEFVKTLYLREGRQFG